MTNDQFVVMMLVFNIVLVLASLYLLVRFGLALWQIDATHVTIRYAAISIGVLTARTSARLESLLVNWDLRNLFELTPQLTVNALIPVAMDAILITAAFWLRGRMEADFRRAVREKKRQAKSVD